MTPGSICAACGQPGHRYGRNEGADTMTCLATSTTIVDSVALQCLRHPLHEGWHETRHGSRTVYWLQDSQIETPTVAV